MQPISPFSLHVQRVSRPAAQKLSDLPKEEQAIFRHIKKTVIATLGKCEVYACGSRVRGNPSLEGAKISDYDVMIVGADLAIRKQGLNDRLTEAVQEKHPKVRVDVFFNEILPNIIIL